MDLQILKNRKPFYNQGLVEVKTLRYLNGYVGCAWNLTPSPS